MKKFHLNQCLVLLLGLFCSSLVFSWCHSIELGYGRSHDPNDSKYTNSGFFLSGDAYPLYRSLHTFWSVNGALGVWQSSAPENKNLTTAAVALALRYYPFSIDYNYPAYVLASVGPAYLSSRHFGTNTQGSNLAFQLFGGLGVELHQFDVNLRLVHYSNAHLANPNEGYNILYLLSIGYLF